MYLAKRWPDDVWEDYIAVSSIVSRFADIADIFCLCKAHPDAKEFRHTGRPLLNLLEELFSGTLATGQHSTGELGLSEGFFPTANNFKRPEVLDNTSDESSEQESSVRKPRKIFRSPNPQLPLQRSVFIRRARRTVPRRNGKGKRGPMSLLNQSMQ
uniref:Uncharacterized protein n=1 Tax=Spongospora subterranea TaxID=70186 RepID=A0A0H5QSK9_9EUKA|eukprot:CRZ04657.1 hypothetical protein [Spongospora subterranea]